MANRLPFRFQVPSLIPGFGHPSLPFVLLCAVQVLAPLAFGAVRPWAYDPLFMAICLAAGLLAAKDAWQGHSGAPTGIMPLAIGAGILMVLQMVPLPGALVAWICPQSAVVAQKALPAGAGFVAIENLATATLAPYVFPVRQSLVRLAAYGFFFWALVRVLDQRSRIEKLLWAVLLVGCFETVYGIAQTYTGANHIWWLERKHYGKDVSGTYINRNHLAGFLEMVLVMAVGYAAALSEARDAKTMRRSGRPKPRLARVIESYFTKRNLVVFGAVVAGLGIVFSASRGGIIAAASALLIQSLLILSRRRHWSKTKSVAAVVTVVVIWASYIGVDYVLKRFESFDAAMEGRNRYVARAMLLAADYRLFGVGPGNFIHAYPRYQDPLDRGLLIDFAHNDWVQMLSEFGIIGSMVILAGAGWMVVVFWRRWRTRQNPWSVCLATAFPSALAAMAIHSLSDFNLHIPANMLTLAATAALGVAAVNLPHGHRQGPRPQRPIRGAGGRIMAIGLLIAVCWTAMSCFRHLAADTNFSSNHDMIVNRDPDPPRDKLRAAIDWDGANAAYWYKLALSLMRSRNEAAVATTDAASDTGLQQIEQALDKAVSLNPFNPNHHISRGLLYLETAKKDDSVSREAADLCFDRAVYFNGPPTVDQHLYFGRYWLQRALVHEPASPGRWNGWQRASWHYRQALALNKSASARKGLLKRIEADLGFVLADPAPARKALEEMLAEGDK